MALLEEVQEVWPCHRSTSGEMGFKASESATASLLSLLVLLCEVVSSQLPSPAATPATHDRRLSVSCHATPATRDRLLPET